MEIDKTTLADLAIFNKEEDFSVLHKLDCTLTTNGREQLRRTLATPLATKAAINDVQHTLRFIGLHEKKWPSQISNGTIMVLERFYEYNFDRLQKNVTSFAATSYKLFHNPDYSLIKYSFIHCFDFVKGMQHFVDHFLSEATPAPLQRMLESAQLILKNPALDHTRRFEKSAELPVTEQLQMAQFIRYHFKQNMLTLLAIHAQLDAWYGMAIAIKKFNLVFPTFENSSQPKLEVKGLYHLLLKQPVPYDVEMDPKTNFLFLTGANMAGKSTFIKSVGTAVFLAHVGMGVPAQQMKLTLFDGMLSNINVIDNIARGESYFYNEVQRIKATITKINDGRKWLILIDELFKGTNVEDAMKCSTAVIEGLLKIKNSLFILSTHLYEIGENLKVHPNISFNYFETSTTDGQLSFNYQMRSGISNDRLGYLILQREGVVDMLENL
jgi:DNA mismatch repair protein MutS